MQRQITKNTKRKGFSENSTGNERRRAAKHPLRERERACQAAKVGYTEKRRLFIRKGMEKRAV